MNQKTTLIVSFCLLCYSSIAQLGQPLEDTLIRAVIRRPSDPASQEVLSSLVLRNEFSRIASPNLNAGLGNFVGLSTSDDNLTFGYSFVNEKSIFELTAQGGVKGGIANIFSSQELNNDASVGFNWNRFFKIGSIALTPSLLSDIREKDRTLVNEKKTLKKPVQDYKKLKETVETKKKAYVKAKDLRLKYEYAPNKGNIIDDSLQTSLIEKKEILLADSALLQSQIDNFNAWKNIEIGKLRSKRDAYSNIDPTKDQHFTVDSLNVLKKKQEYIKALSYKKKELAAHRKKITQNIVITANHPATLQELKDTEERTKLAFDIATEDLATAKLWQGKTDTQKENELNKNISDNLRKIYDLRAKNIRMIYTSFGGNIKNESFSLFDPTKTPSQRLTKTSYFTPSLNFSITYYAAEKMAPTNLLNGHHIRFFTIGASLTYGNNLSSLTQLDVITMDSVDANTFTQTSQKAYSGNFQDSIVTGQLFSDYYQFLGKRDNVGFHLRGTVDFVEKKSPITSLRAGLIFAAVKNGEDKSIVNFEVFYGWNDLFGNSSRESLFSRNIIGIQTSFPFDFKIKSK